MKEKEMGDDDKKVDLFSDSSQSDIQVESYIALPAERSLFSSSQGKEQKILIVDDEPYNVLGLQMMMRQIGYKRLKIHVERAFNGMQALEITKEALARGQVFGIIFMDCSMPIMDGFESSILIRKFYRDQGVQQPIIVACTGHTEDEYIAQAWRSEIDELVPKPIKSKILKLILDEIVYRF